MAGFADANTTSTLHNTTPSSARARSSRRSLPNGPCNHRDIVSGACGCDQFWDKCSAELHDELAELPSRVRSTWCVCGHHACFHSSGSRVPEQSAPPTATSHLIPAKSDDEGQSLPVAQLGTEAGVKQLENVQIAHSGRFASQTGSSQRMLRQVVSPGNTFGGIELDWDTPSQASTSGLPGIPSVCRMISHDGDLVANNETNQDLYPSRQRVAGLGLSTMQLHSAEMLNRQHSPMPLSNSGSVARAPQPSFSEPETTSTRANSVATEANRFTSSSRGLTNQVVGCNRHLQLDVDGDTIPNTYNPNDSIQSATEVATPSITNTPDLGAADQAVEEGKHLIDTLARLTSNLQQPDGSLSRPTSDTPAPGSQQWLTNSSAAHQEQLQSIIRSASPQALHKLVSYLAPLHNLLISIPNVANTMRDLGNRLDMLESGSFNYVQPEDFNQTLSMYDDRLVELEYRMNEHDKHHQAIDADYSSNSYTRRRLDMNASFGSNHSLQSTTSSALILAAIDRKDTEIEIGDIKERLETLEAAALPTTYQPWDIEVVFLPWGRDLRGIWFSPDEPMHELSKPTTQNSEEWTQARGSKLAQSLQPSQLETSTSNPDDDDDTKPHAGARTVSKEPITSDPENGWSSQAISDWASGSAEDWLFPKACASNNLIYKRLQSRGFVRYITLKGASARDLQITLSRAFSDLSEHLSYTEQDGDATVAAYPGLRASFIPLRKVLKDSKLQFLTPAEMASSALWSAQFLAAGVLMRACGGKKRLYVTQREAYCQPIDDLRSAWTWQELRELPRYQADQDSQMEGNDEHCQPKIPEADAKEACWQYIGAYDAPPASVHSSFGSHQSVRLSMRPSDRRWRRSLTPTSIMKVKAPISPLSEFHPRPNNFRNRTVSTPVVEPIPTGSMKRRLNSSPVKQSSAPQPASRTPSVSVARLKRRRTANSPPPQLIGPPPAQAQVTIWNPTPRRSREPPSPFYPSVPAIARSSSDVTSRPSQRSIAAVGKSTPFGYATPHSGNFTGGPGFGGYNNGGDTEPDEDDDGEQSWRGVTEGDENGDGSSASSEPDPEDGTQHGANFSGEDSGFGTESDDDEDDAEQSEMSDSTHRNPTNNEDDVFDSLLDVLEH
jgi:hypothetical protein